MRFLFMALVALTLASTARADGLLFQLPEDRSFVKYDMELTVEGQGNTINGSVTLKSVGQTIEDGEKCRWIELEFKSKTTEGADQLITFKTLLQEKHLKAGANPLEKIVRGWRKENSEGTTQFTDASGLALAPLAVFLSGPLKDAKPLDKQFEDTKLGNLECTGEKGTQEIPFGEAKMIFNTELRRHEKAPFGVVRAEYQFELKDKDGNVPARGNVRLKLADFGKDAVSNLPDSQ